MTESKATPLSSASHRKKPHFEYEFGGPVGALTTTISLPIVTLFLLHFAAAGGIDFQFLSSCSNVQDQVCPARSNLQSFLQPITCPNCPVTSNGVDWTPLFYSFLAVVSWFLFQVLLERYLPADLIPGTKLRDGSKLLYRINGHLAFWVTLLVVDVGWPHFTACPFHGGKLQFGRAPLSLLYDYYVELATSAVIGTILLSFYMYSKSFTLGAILALGGNSGNHFYDFFIGRELNPRPYSQSTFDWKEFCELRTGLIGWVLLNLGMASKQHQKLGYVSGSMILINIFQALYVLDALYQERAILTTMDITTDGFGFMLIFGDLAWVPFTYSLQARFLVDHDPNLSWYCLLGVVVCNFIGYKIFRGANGQKDAFRRDPDGEEVKHLTYLQTKRGTKLLTSGWWGKARKINYTGDWIMGFSWCMVCGFKSIVPYYYAIYFAILLVHRSMRDDHACHVKYGDDWLAYKKLVPYRFIPGVV